MSEKELVKRIEKLEKTMKALTISVQKMLAEFSVVKQTPDRFKTPFYLVKDTPNPWAQQAVEELPNIIHRVGRNIVTTSPDTYKPTLQALIKKSEGATASEIAEITGRKRNTESAYLRRLNLAGLVEAERKKNRTVYKLKNEEELKQLFGSM
ncbi:MAG: winged helix-turn-helix domain-containing protein [Thermoproteota archaeon]